MKAQEKLALVIGAIVIVLALAGGLVYGLYRLVSQWDYNTLRWLVVAALLLLPAEIIVTYRIATHSAREHLAGFERGLTGSERTILAIGRGLSATASIARTARPAAAQPAMTAAINPAQVVIMPANRALATSDDILEL